MKKYCLFLLGTIFISLLTAPSLIANANEYWYMGIIAGVIFGYLIMELSNYLESSLSSKKELDDKITNIAAKLGDINETNLNIVESQNSTKNAIIKTLSEESVIIRKSIENAIQQLLVQNKEISSLIQLLNTKTDVLSDNVVKVSNEVQTVISKNEETNVLLNKIAELNKNETEVFSHGINNITKSIIEQNNHLSTLSTSLSENIESQINDFKEQQRAFVSDTTNHLCNIVNKNNNRINETIEHSSKMVNASINGISNHLSGIDTIVKIQQEKMDMLDSEIKNSFTILESYKNQSEKLVTNVISMINVINELNDKFSNTIIAINNCVSSSIKKQDEAIDEIERSTHNMTKTVDESIGNLDENLSLGIKSLKNSINESLELLIDEVDELSSVQEKYYENINTTNEFIKKIFADKKLEDKERELISKLEAACKKH